MLKNKYVQQMSRYAMGFTGLSITYLVFSAVKKKWADGHTDATKKHLETIIDPAVVEILDEEDYLDIVRRMAHFQPLDPVNFQSFVDAVINIRKFFIAKEGRETTMNDAAEYARIGHQMIECVRNMRAFLELRTPSCLEDFDEVAVDVQSKYDEDRESILFDAQLKY
jgi:hypothetical protein